MIARSKLIHVVLFFISCVATLSGQNRVDSMTTALKNATHDSVRAALYVGLSSEMFGSKPDSVIPLCLKALDLIETLPASIAGSRGMLYAKTTALNNIGVTYSSKGAIAKALDYFLISFKITEKIGEKEGIAMALSNIGTIYQNQGDDSKALDYYHRSLKIIQEIGYKKMMSQVYNNIGSLYYNRGEISKALDFYEMSLKIKEEVGDKTGQAISFNNLGALYDNQGNIAKSFDYYTKSLKINQDIDDKSGIATALKNIGTFYSKQGDLARALDYNLKSLKIEEDLGDKPGIASSLSNLGVLYNAFGEKSKALEYHQKSLKIKEEIGSKQGVASSLHNIGFLYQDIDANIALDYYHRSLKIRQEIGDKKGITGSLNNISYMLRKQKKYPEAKIFGKLSLQAALKLGFLSEIKSASAQLYVAYLKTQEPDSAFIHLSRLMKLIKSSLSNNYATLSEKEKEFYFATLEHDFMRFYDFTLTYCSRTPALADTAYNISLTTKGLTLKSSTATRNAILESKDSLLISEYEEWRRSKKKMARLYESGKDVKELESKLNELEKKLLKKSIAFSDLEKVKNLDWKQVRSALKKDESAIEFVHFTSEIDSLTRVFYAALIVKPESIHPEMIMLCAENDLKAILAKSQGSDFGFVNKVYGTKKEAQTALYEKVWKPLEPSLKGVKKVYYSPTGLLHKVSFAAISKSSNIYLCDNYKLHQQSSTGKVALPDNINYSTEDEFMLAGGVKYNSVKTNREIWKYLPGTLSETQNIQKILTANKHKTNYLALAEANEESFKKNVSSVHVLHIATHGFFFPDPEHERENMRKVNETVSKTVNASETNQSLPKDSVTLIGKPTDIVFRGSTNYANWSFVNNKNPLMRSGLILANANDVWERDPLAEGEDGILTAQEVSNLDLRKTKLVVLSACETGLGDIKGSEGVYGLQRAFKMAGVKYIIMSLWQVPDKETSEFMTMFYTKLTKVKDIKKAFNDTQKEMRKRYDPYFWAAFVLLE